ncbi:MAG: hypothetical protein ACK6DZ_24225 [Acidobacteriota bacterium]
MLSRRILFAAFAPATSPAYSGIPNQAVYDGRTRRTKIWFTRVGIIWLGALDHDRFLASPPVQASAVSEPDLPLPKPRIRLSVSDSKLAAIDDRGRKIATLMSFPTGASVHIVTPRAAHADLVAIWSFGQDLYFTNNDYRNVYQLPSRMGREPLSPGKLRLD